LEWIGAEKRDIKRKKKERECEKCSDMIEKIKSGEKI